MDNIRSLIGQKRDKIKIYSKSKLKGILENLKDENEFQDIIYEILHDLGFSDIKINCGRRGHSEFGKDIVFSHIHTPANAEKIQYPSICSVCNTPLVDEGTRLYCPNKDCSKRAYHRLQKL